ncbi:MAG: phosphoribosylaminoimidazolesuccinocarboxamide synthase [candidate division Zixibacteria bacterium]|nr:phosphoribosylaminoimidazolesuccinocarboxamide synthase [candidate division Zixibacteria bacterium]
MDTLMQTEMPDIKLFARGKVRDVYDLEDKLLIVATDRISAFDWVLPDPIPGKGKVLTAMSLFWFDYLKDVVPNHLLSADVNDYPESLKKYRDQLEGRSMLVRKAERIEVECIVRGYISGSLWQAYRQGAQSGNTKILGFDFVPDLQESQKLAEPIFTPSTKADDGHDENISFETMLHITGMEVGAALRQVSKELYRRAADYSAQRGIILADTKFEFGFIAGELTLIDEVLSPDSSRFWPADKYKVGRSQESFDKQYVRDFLSSTDWDKDSEPPHLPAEVIKGTSERYQLAQKLLLERTGK